MGVDHLDLVVSSLERGLDFYLGLLGPLGWGRPNDIVGERGERVVYLHSDDGGPEVSLRERPPDAPAGPYDRYAIGLHHLAFSAPSREAVDDRHRWAIERGVEIETPPREYDYGPGYYALFLHDPDGIKLEIVHQPDEPGPGA